MASLLKNQIIKHLARFFKNLSPEQFNLSTLRGQCALTNLELNEELLAELLELPAWIVVRKAVCSRVHLNVPWIKIKSQPIQLSLDQVHVELNTCTGSQQENGLRAGCDGKVNVPNRSTSGTSGTSGGSKYGFADKVLDGVRIRIDSLDVVFSSPVVRTQLSLLQIVIESRLPNFKQTDDLAHTRLKDPHRRHVLLFKHIQFASMRFEVRSEYTGRSSPLRLITRDGSCRITLKKRLSDGQLVAGRLLLQFDELLWIVTDGTLLSALHLLQHISQLMDEAPMSKQNLPNFSGSMSNEHLTANAVNDRLAQLFAKYDVKESSLHVLIQTLQLHLSDELQRSQCDPLKMGGGVHVQLCRLVVDLYPYHFLQNGKRNWFCYTSPNSLSTDQLFERHLIAHLSQSDPNWADQTAPEHMCQSMKHKFHNLFSSALVVRVGDIRVRCVSTSGSSGRAAEDPKKSFLRTNGALPDNLPSIHIEFHQFFFFEGPDRRRASLRQRAPDPLMYVHISPMLLCPDSLTMLWANAFLHSVQHGLQEIGAFDKSLFDEASVEQVAERIPHVLIELVLPTLQLNLGYLALDATKLNLNEANSNVLELKCSRITLTNSVGFQKSSLKQLLIEMNKIKRCPVIKDGMGGYPWMAGDLPALNDTLQRKLQNMLTSECKSSHNWQFWHINLEPVWVDSIEMNSQRRKAFVDPIPINCWTFISLDFASQSNQAPLNVIASLPEVNITANHQQFILLLRILEQVDEMMGWLGSDAKHIAGQHQKMEQASLLNFSALLEQINVNVLLDIPASVADVKQDMPEYVHKKLTRLVQINQSNLDSGGDSGVQISMVSQTIAESESTVCDDLDEEEDEKSLRSDLSGDIDRLASLILDDLQDDYTNGGQRLFAGIPGVLQDDNDMEPVEEAMEMTEELNLNLPSITNTYEKVLITINNLLTIRQQVADGTSCSIVEIPDINIELAGDASQAMYQSNGDADSVSQSIVLRLDCIPQAECKNAKQFASVVIRNLSRLQVDADFLHKLTDFLTDPETEQVHSVLALFDNSSVRLVDPQVKTPPIELCLDKTLIERNQSNQVRFTSTQSLQQGIAMLIAAHQRLRRRSEDHPVLEPTVPLQPLASLKPEDLENLEEPEDSGKPTMAPLHSLDHLFDNQLNHHHQHLSNHSNYSNHLNYHHLYSDVQDDLDLNSKQPQTFGSVEQVESQQQQLARLRADNQRLRNLVENLQSQMKQINHND